MSRAIPKEIIPKQKDHAFGKDVFLLGRDKKGIRYWLEAPSWDCSWYWGFGYVETYRNNWLPSNAADIDSHQHIPSFLGKQECYDPEKKCYFLSQEHVANLYNSWIFDEGATTFTEAEGWNLSELFEQFYLLKKMAEFSHRERPGCHITTSPVNHGSLKTWNNKINEVMIPKVTAKIVEILSPKEV